MSVTYRRDVGQNMAIVVDKQIVNGKPDLAIVSLIGFIWMQDDLGFESELKELIKKYERVPRVR